MRHLAKNKVIGQKRVLEAKKRTIHKVSKNDFLTNENIVEIIERRRGTCKICIIRSVGGIGDVVMTLPALKELKTRYPNIELSYAIDMHTTKHYYEMVKNLPYIDKVLDARLVDRRDYHGVCDISSVCIKYEHSQQRPLNRIDIFARAIGLNKLDQPKPELLITSDERSWAKHFLAQVCKAGQKIVCLHSASFEGKRSWPPHKYIELVDLCTSQNLPIKFLLFDFNNVLPSLKTHSMVVDCSLTNIREMMALIEASDYFIGPDSGPMHLAGAIGTKSLVLFGSIPGNARINHYPSHEALSARLPCSPCWYAPCNIGVKCMKDILSATVFAKMKSKLGV